MGKIDTFTMGHSGVVLDMHPLEPSLPEDSLHSAQNATHDGSRGRGGAIVKRPGLRRFNLAAAGGAILGGIPMPVAEFGGAPVSGGGGNTYDDSGVPEAPLPDPLGVEPTTGPGVIDDSLISNPGGAETPTYAPPGAPTAFIAPGAFNGRLVAFGRVGTTSSSGEGWWINTRGWIDTPQVLTAPGPPLAYPSRPNLKLSAAASTVGPLFCLDASKQWTYYQKDSGDGGTSTTARQIRRTNGATDQLVGTFAATSTNPDSGYNRWCALHISFGSDGYVYVATRDTIGNDAETNWRSRILKVNPANFAFETLYTSSLHYIKCVHARFGNIGGSARIFYGSYNATINNGCKIMVSDASGAAFTEDNNGSTGLLDFDAVTCFAEYNGRLFCGFRMNETTPITSLFASRSPTKLTTDASAWNFNTGLSSMITGNGSFVTHMLPWRDGKLYVSVFDYVGGKTAIFAVQASDTSDPENLVFTSTLVHSITGAGAVPLYLWDDPADPNYDNGYLYAVGGDGFGNGGKVYVTQDGITWTTRTALATGGISSAVGPVFIGMEQ